MNNKLKWYSYERCFLCDGIGTIEVKCHTSEEYGRIEECPTCHGAGELKIQLNPDGNKEN